MELVEGTLPTLSREGFIVNPKAIMVKCFEHFLVSDQSQSTTFMGEVVSLKYLISIHKDTLELKNGIVDALTKLYKRYFPTVVVNVEVEESDTSSVVKYTIDITCYDTKGDPYSLSKEISESANQLLDFDTLITDLRKVKEI